MKKLIFLEKEGQGTDVAEALRGSGTCKNGLSVILAMEPMPSGRLATPCPAHRGLKMIRIITLITITEAPPSEVFLLGGHDLTLSQ